MLANRLGTRLGRSGPIAAAAVALATAFYLTGAGGEPKIFVGAIIAYGVAYFFILPYVLGLAVQFDREGRVSVINSMMPWVAHLVSPLLGAALLAHGTFSMMGATSATTMLVAATFVIVAGMGSQSA